MDTESTPQPGDRLILDWDPGNEAPVEVTVIAIPADTRGLYEPGDFDVVRDGDRPAQATTVTAADIARGATWTRA